jgi:nucleotide-binding universal stress UspA family protein
MKHLLEKDKRTRLKSSSLFIRGCKKAQISYTIHHDKSFAIQELLKESVYSDMLLIGADETLNHFTEDRPTQFIRDLLTEAQCPVMIVPSEYKEVEKVVLLYDGKPSSVFAIKMFNYMMPWLRSKETEVLSVLDPKTTPELQDENLIKEFIQCHYPDAIYTLLSGDPEEEIINYLKTTPKNVLVVLGAYRRSQVSRWFKISMADLLIRNIDMPLFIAHNR